MSEFTDFEKAIMRNRVLAVKQFLKDGEEPDSYDIVLAIESKANNVLKVLIDAGADLDEREAHFRYTPLIRALYERNLEAFRILLKAGAAVNKKGLSRAPLHEAAKEGLVEFGKLCIAAGAKLELRDHSGNTPLMSAAGMGKLGMVKLLIRAGANPLALNLADKTSCQIAEENGDRHVVKFLAPISTRKPPVKRGAAALVQAVEKQDMAALERGLKRGIDVNGRDKFGCSPLNVAISSGSIPFIKRLIQAGINVNGITPDGRSFLQCSLMAEKLDIAKFLLQAGALPNPPGSRYSDAIKYASSLGDIELVKLLLTKGSNPQTPGLLDSAANKKDVGMIRLLLEAGASVNAVDYYGRTPLFSAVFTGPPLPKAYRDKDLKKLAAKGIIVTPLPKQSDVEEAIGLLLDRGADVNHRDNDGRTPLAHTWWLSVARMLIDAGARLDIPDKDGRSIKFWLKRNGVDIRKL